MIVTSPVRLSFGHPRGTQADLTTDKLKPKSLRCEKAACSAAGAFLVPQCRSACQLPEHRCADNTPFQTPAPELFCSQPLPTARSAAR
jgi:hypothetical protein